MGDPRNEAAPDEFSLEMRWIDRHSVNCIICDRLFDERESLGQLNGEGDICPDHEVADEPV